MFRQYGFPAPRGPRQIHSKDCQAREQDVLRNGCPNSSKCWLPMAGHVLVHRGLTVASPFATFIVARLVPNRSDDALATARLPWPASSSPRGKRLLAESDPRIRPATVAQRFSLG